jgi:hypothetical protein
MRPVSQPVAGEILSHGKVAALVLRDLAPPANAENVVILRFALVTRGPGDHIFPAFVLDDWGNEIGSLKLYRWIREHGERFPRGEIFGYERDGRDTQAFLREIELHARLPCYAYSGPDAEIDEGQLLTSILIPQANLSAPRQIQPPEDIKGPLKFARVVWWQIPTAVTDLDLDRLQTTPDPGY